VANETSITVVGNLTDEPDLRFLPSGAAMCRFTVASTPRVFDSQAGAWKDGETLFMGCTVWRDLAEHAAESLAKGVRVVVVGRLRQWRYETEQGEKRSGFGLEVDEVGPSLRFATATVKRMARARAGSAPEAPPSEEWATASRERPALATV
jgi:single-strand DNA-binding protein